jgi:hypothetical protein
MGKQCQDDQLLYGIRVGVFVVLFSFHTRCAEQGYIMGRNSLSWSIQYVITALSIVAGCSQNFPASYDYGAAISESRELTDKYAELKRQGFFLRSSPEFYKTDWIGNSSTGVVTTTNPAAFVTLLRNPDSKASFYIVRPKDSTSMLVSTLCSLRNCFINSSPR